MVNEKNNDWLASKNPWSIWYDPYFSWGDASRERLEQLDVRLVHMCNKLADIYDMTILCAHRGEHAQNQAYAEGHSQLKWSSSKHNSLPARAVDLSRYPVDWEDRDSFHMMLGSALAISHEAGYIIKLGKYFNNLEDLPHIEVM